MDCEIPNVSPNLSKFGKAGVLALLTLVGIWNDGNAITAVQTEVDSVMENQKRKDGGEVSLGNWGGDRQRNEPYSREEVTPGGKPKCLANDAICARGLAEEVGARKCTRQYRGKRRAEPDPDTRDSTRSTRKVGGK